HVIRVGDGPERPGVIGWQSWIDEAQSELTPFEVSPDQPAFWLYTSGTTGRPKAVVHLHRALPYVCQHFGRETLGLTETDVCLSAAKSYHAYGLGNSLGHPLYLGASAVLWPRTPLPAGMFELINRLRVSVFFATPALFVGMLALPEPEKRYDLSTLRF